MGVSTPLTTMCKLTFRNRNNGRPTQSPLNLAAGILGVFIVLCCVHGCDDKAFEEKATDPWHWQLPSTFDSIPPVPHDNAMSTTRVALGRALFFDPRLSADGSVSCGSCHKPALAYADTVAVSPGVHARSGFRNSPSLLNVAYQKALFREGGIPSLEVQVLAPFTTDDEMDINLRDVHERLSADSAYQQMSMAAYGQRFEPLVMARALAAFQRSLLSTGSAYDAYMAGDSSALGLSAKRGRQLFYSDELACSSCHTGFLFTDMLYHNTGLYSTYEDEGRGRLSMRTADMGRMKTPSLRNVALTWPYMHNGSLPTLDAVLHHYNSGGMDHPNKDARIRPLNLDSGQLIDLKAFLETLSDLSLVE